ncbi:PmoA family protein [Membranicola marinus]|uniref:PmoA family protein n=1 Tax=Membranihabitans marinus TaxID=1227546 RepID=A0A953HZE2_9BACT|nr:DUF6807 family protein [Membranihabitans marinus]MBY5958502.1 PmoA family protein [Membranihabitans marinus]
MTAKLLFFVACLASTIAVAVSCSAPSTDDIVLVNHSYGEEWTTTPVSFDVELSEALLTAARENRLVLTGVSDHAEISVQLDKELNAHKFRITALLPGGHTGKQEYQLTAKDKPAFSIIQAEPGQESAQPFITEGNQKVLQYNYEKVHAEDVVRPGGEKKELTYSEFSSGIYYEELLKSHPTYPKDTVLTGAVYGVPRSDYIHPLYGLNGEMLTRDWPDGGHPHHRGIFWAWPEVEYNGQRGDIYALQRVFARPTGKIDFISGPVYAQIYAENRWMWEDEVPIVHEQVTIRAYRANDRQRIIDLTLEFQALEENITLATRFTDSYGGLNIRMQTPEEQEISYFTDEPGGSPSRAWADFNGIFEGNEAKSGLMILQHKSNPEYPGDWVEYPNLSWIQPTFPTPKSRYRLSLTEPLVLRYRFVVHAGGEPTPDVSKAYWDAYNSQNLPQVKDR